MYMDIIEVYNIITAFFFFTGRLYTDSEGVIELKFGIELSAIKLFRNI